MDPGKGGRKDAGGRCNGGGRTERTSKKAGVKAAIPLLEPEMTITNYRFDGQQWFLVSHKKLEKLAITRKFLVSTAPSQPPCVLGNIYSRRGSALESSFNHVA